MNRKILTGVGLIGIVLLTGFNINVGMNNSNSFNVTLEKIESLAGCEVSSDFRENTGHCMKEKDSDRDVCVSGVAVGASCSGNF